VVVLDGSEILHLLLPIHKRTETQAELAAELVEIFTVA
jgi:hypothetical protein